MTSDDAGVRSDRDAESLHDVGLTDTSSVDEWPAEEPPAPRSSAAELLRLMESLADVDRISVTRLARHIGMPVPTAHRMLRTLTNAGFAEQVPETREYRLTLRLFEIGSHVASRTTLRDIASVEIERLAQQAEMAANFGIMVDQHVLYLDKVETDELLTLNLRPGSRAPVTSTGMGKAMLAWDSRPLRTLVGQEPYPAMTPHSITRYDELAAAIDEVRALGYAVDREELGLGLWCVAAAIPGGIYGQSGAVSVASAGTPFSEEDCKRLGMLVRACADRIARRSGGTHR